MANLSRTRRRRHAGIRYASAPQANTHGGTIINLIVAVVFFGLIALGIWWVIKMTGQATQQYLGTAVQTRLTAETVKCQSNLRAISQNLQMYAVSNGRMPASREELVRWSGSTQLFRCPDPNGGDYVYIPGQRPDMPGSNVLLYEPNAVHDGRCSVLLLGGEIGLATPEELKQGIQITLTKLK